MSRVGAALPSVRYSARAVELAEVFVMYRESAPAVSVENPAPRLVETGVGAPPSVLYKEVVGWKFWVSNPETTKYSAPPNGVREETFVGLPGSGAVPAAVPSLLDTWETKVVGLLVTKYTLPLNT